MTTEGIRGRNLATDPPAEAYPCEQLLRHALAELGWRVAIERPGPGPEAVHLMISRHRNGFVFAGFSPEADAALLLRTPLGAPVLPGREARLAGGSLRWPVWHWFHEECRVFVEQESGTLRLNPEPAKDARYRRRWLLSGLRDATVRFFPERGYEQRTRVLVNPDVRYWTTGDPCRLAAATTPWGTCIELRQVTGQVTFAWAPDEAVEPVKILTGMVGMPPRSGAGRA